MHIFGVRKRFYLPPIIFIIMLYIISVFSPAVEAKHVYGIFPAFIIQTDAFLNEGDAGSARAFIVIIRPGYNDNETVEHELVHVKQAYRTFFTDWVLCWFSEEHLAKRECEAYATQMRYSDIEYFVPLIQEEYSPNVPVETIESFFKIYLTES